MTWPNGIAVAETIMALSAKLTVTETRLAEAEVLLREAQAGLDVIADQRKRISWNICDRIDAFLTQRAP